MHTERPDFAHVWLVMPADLFLGLERLEADIVEVIRPLMVRAIRPQNSARLSAIIQLFPTGLCREPPLDYGNAVHDPQNTRLDNYCQGRLYVLGCVLTWRLPPAQTSILPN